MPSITLSVIVEIVCRDTSAPYTSARCALISPVVNPFADRDSTMSSTPAQPPLPLAHDLRIETALTVPRHSNLDRPDIGEHRLGPTAVAGVPAILPGRVVLLIAEVVGNLPVQRGLEHPLRQLLQQTTFAGQLQTRCAGLLDQPADQLAIHALRRHR